ncbi:RrF2 family transcriptional regulator [Melioribacter sp. Ez-97]|uniref:RrF2 family transcriptional regulator n=1 Tax=Melioribacter sp. Ez-97 TaxID=3423434 RepID=UPI003EDA7E2A
MMLLNSKIRYGIRVLFYLMEIGRDEVFTAAEISRQLRLPKEFISKIMQILSYEGILNSKKGKGGGFYLAADPSDVSFEKVFKALGYDEHISECIFDMKESCNRNSCPFCTEWKSFIADFNNTIKNYSITGERIT